MTRAAVCEFDQFFLIISGCLNVTVQTPPHIHDLGILCNKLLGHIAVAFFTVTSCRNVRAVVELAGVKNMLSKSFGRNNPINLVKATFDALSQLRTREEAARLRGVPLDETV